jgi:hypothetical protein
MIKGRQTAVADYHLLHLCVLELSSMRFANPMRLFVLAAMSAEHVSKQQPEITELRAGNVSVLVQAAALANYFDRNICKPVELLIKIVSQRAVIKSLTAKDIFVQKIHCSIRDRYGGDVACMEHVLLCLSMQFSFFFFSFFGWGETESIRYVGHYLIYCTSPG